MINIVVYKGLGCRIYKELPQIKKINTEKSSQVITQKKSEWAMKRQKDVHSIFYMLRFPPEYKCIQNRISLIRKKDLRGQ